ncbi:MAG: hypothetical protein R3200_17115, partial [Xanthomonadales bacterium]|nr:hypothetical protein [Xanthomonadales bacterium]
AGLIFGFRYFPGIELAPALLSLPMLVIYPLFVGFNAYWLSVKLSKKQKTLKKLSQIDGLTGRCSGDQQSPWKLQRMAG